MLNRVMHFSFMPLPFPALCSAHAVLLPAGYLLGLTAAGAAGSLAHCGPMCGPFVLGQVADRMAAIPGPRLNQTCRWSQGLLLPYHAGRLSTYGLLGAICGGAGGALLPPLLRQWLLLAGATWLLWQAWSARGGAVPPSATVGLLGRLARKLDRRRVLGSYLFGLLLGLLPCGLLYTALAAASVSGNAAAGAATMLAFGAGTLPALMMIGLGGRRLPAAWLRGTGAPMLKALNAGVLVLLSVAGHA